jgi:uncharacterized RDD family membrane protein YckC
VEGAYWVRPTEPPLPVANVKLAGYLPRFAAYFIDMTLWFTLVLADVLAQPAPRPSERPVIGVDTIILLALIAIYYPFCWARGGQTIGMRIVGLRVVRDPDASRIGWRTALLRLFGFWLNGIVLYLGWLWIFVDRRRRGWHDLIARTIVVDERSLREYRARQSTGPS